MWRVGVTGPSGFLPLLVLFLLFTFTCNDRNYRYVHWRAEVEGKDSARWIVVLLFFYSVLLGKPQNSSTRGGGE